MFYSIKTKETFDFWNKLQNDMVLDTSISDQDWDVLVAFSNHTST
jgi:hypothetical protein